jgi:hypothetical protein
MNRQADAGVNPKAAPTRPSASERLLAAADEPFYENGINLDLEAPQAARLLTERLLSSQLSE